MFSNECVSSVLSKYQRKNIYNSSKNRIDTRKTHKYICPEIIKNLNFAFKFIL